MRPLKTRRVQWLKPSTLRPGGEPEMAINQPQMPIRAMSASGQSRRFGDVRASSALALKADIHHKARHVSKVPMNEPARAGGAGGAVGRLRLPQ